MCPSVFLFFISHILCEVTQTYKIWQFSLFTLMHCVVKRLSLASTSSASQESDGSHRLIIVFTTACYLPLSSQPDEYSMPSNSVSLRSILISYSNLCHVFQVASFLQIFLPKCSCIFLYDSMCATCPAHLIYTFGNELCDSISASFQGFKAESWTTQNIHVLYFALGPG